jgi:RNA polymerase sigma-70 factor (ECF subfamily)
MHSLTEVIADMPDDATPGTRSDPATWLDTHGDSLYRFALQRVRDPATAEDLVQETLLAAWHARDKFAGKSAERTWLIAILKNKLIDHLRRSRREAPLPDADLGDEVVDTMFAEHDGHWARTPAAWSKPDDALEQAEFWKILQACLEALPARHAQAFNLSEIDGLSTDQLCKVLEVQPSNVWVMLHRARLRLRECLELRWFGLASENR